MRLEELEEWEITVEELDWLLRGSTIRRAKFGAIPETIVPQVSSTAIDVSIAV